MIGNRKRFWNVTSGNRVLGPAGLDRVSLEYLGIDVPYSKRINASFSTVPRKQEEDKDGS